MHDSANQMDTSPAFSMLPDPDEGFGGAGIGFVGTRYQGVDDAFNHTPAPYLSEDTHFPTPALGTLVPESSVATSSAGLFYGPDISLDNSRIQNHDNSLGTGDNSFASPYAGQSLSLGDYANGSQLQGCNNHGYGKSQAGYNNSVIDFDNDYQNQPHFIENQALTTELNPQVHFLGGQMNSFGVNVYENPCVEFPALYHPNFTNAVYPNQTYSDATFADFNAADPSLCDLTASSLNFSDPAFPGQTFSAHTFTDPELLASILSGQNFSTDQYQLAAYQNMHLPAQDFHSSLISDGPILPTVPTHPTRSALSPIHQQPSFPCTQPGCLATVKREADRIRHESTLHGSNNGLHLCPIPGCVKAHGRGYSRADKVTEHLWKHGDLGYVKRV